MTDLLDSLIGKEPQGDPLDDIFQQEREARTSTLLRNAGNPDQAGQANDISRRVGVPPSIVEANLPDFQRREQAQQIQDLTRDHPAIGRFATDPRNLAVMADDYSALNPLAKSMMERDAYWKVRNAQGSISSLPKPQASFSNIVAGLREQLKTGVSGVNAMISDWVTPFFLNKHDAKFAAERSQLATEDAIHRAADTNPDFKSSTASGLYSGASSFAMMLPGIAASVVARNPAPAIASAALLTQTQAYAKYRARGGTRGEALAGSTGEGLIEGVGEMLPMGVIVNRFGAGPVKKWIGEYLVKEGLTEQAQQHAQDAVDTAIANPNKTWGEYLSERPDTAYQTALATLVGSAAIGTLSEGSRHLVGQRDSAENAKADAVHITNIMDAASKSKLRERDPTAFQGLINELSKDSGSDMMYADPKAMKSYMQSDRYGGEFDDYRDSIDEGLATGGDVVIPLSEAVTKFAGTPAWAAIKDDVRMTPGGQSLREAQTFDEAMSDHMAEIADKFAAQDEKFRKEMEPRDRLMQSIADKLMNAGFTPTNARSQAELLTQRAATRSARTGQELNGSEFDSVAVNQVLPERLAQAQKADGLDMAINVMQKKVDAKDTRGPGLLDFIAKNGGVDDKGGDLKSMGADKWHKDKPGRRKLIRDTSGDGQTSMIGGITANKAGLDHWAHRAWEAGYFPEHNEPPSANDLINAIGEGIAGRDRHTQSQDKSLRDAAEELRALLESRGIDADKATTKEIRGAVDKYVAEQKDGVGYDQVDVNSEAFKKWFGASKVVDARGHPLVVYHGTNADIDAFDKEKVGTRWDVSIGFHFSDRTDEANIYAGSELGSGDGSVIPAYLKIENPLVIETSGQAWRYADDNRFEIIKEIVQSRRKAAADDPKKRKAEDDALLADLLGAFEENPFSEAEFAPTVHKRSEYKPLSAYDGIIIKGSDGANFIAFEPTQIKSVNNRGTFDPADPRILYQSFNDGPRGRITFPIAGFGTGPSVIDLFQSRDQSTFLHETGHLWLEELRYDAMGPNATDQLKADWQAVQDWFAANGHPLQDGVIPTDAHEMWARGVERYLMEGKAPVPALRKIFQDFKAWLIQIYRSVDRLKSPISDEIRGVMDRLIATDTEIAQAAEQQHLESGFTEKPVTMTAGEWGEYQKLVGDAKGDAHDALLAKTMNAIRRRVTKEYKERAETVRNEVSESINNRPEFRALRLLKDTPLDAVALREEYGEDVGSLLPRQVPPVLKDGGANADEVAELSGFKSGDEMVRTLMGVETRRRELKEGGDKRSVRVALIEQEVDARMMERYGDPFTDGSIEEEALAAVHNEKQGEVLAAELRVLSRSTGDSPTPYRAAKAWAERTVREGIVKDVVSRSAIQRYQRAASKAGKASTEAILKGDHAEAFKQKQAQMLNNALISEANKVGDEVEKAQARMEKWAKRKTIKSVDQDYLERAQALLEQVDLRPRSQASLDKHAQFEAWAGEQEALGHDIIVPASFAATLGTTHWSRLSVETFLGLDAAVDQIIHLGRFKQTLIDNKEARDFEEVVQEAEAGGDRLGRKPPSNLMEPDWKERISSGVAAVDAALLKMETVFDWLDNGNPNGVFNRIVFRPVAEAEASEKAMLTDYYGRVRDAFSAIDGKQLKRWQQSFETPELMDRNSGKPFKMRREHLIAMALNMGNEGNIQRLTDGYGWNEQGVREVLNRELSEQDWRFVQQIWDIVDTLWPDISAMERRVNGVEPDKVEAKPIETPYGTLKGGYYPAIYDSAKDYAAEVRAGRAGDLLETTYTRSTTRASSTKDRAAKVSRPILLQLGVINRHLGEVIHDITHREAVMQADKFLTNPRVMKTIDEVLNPEIRKQMRPWLKFVANQWAMERAGNEGIGKWLGKARSNTTIVGMGFRASTILTQIAGYSNSYEYVGAGWVNHGIAAFVKNPIKTFDFVMEKSAEIRGRMDSIDRDIRNTMQEMAGQNKAGRGLTAAKRFAFHGIGYMDRVVVVPTWVGAYNKALSENMSDDEAVYYADKAVRLSQGSGSPKDLAAVQRGTGKWGEFLKLTTMFYSYMSAFYQRERTLGRDVARAGARDFPALMARAFWLIVVPPILSQILSGNGPDDDEDWGIWSFKQMLFNTLGPLPVVRDLVRPVWDKAANNKGFDYQLSPIQRAGQTMVEFAGDVGDLARGDETKRMTRNALETVGYATGLVPGQIAAAVQFLVDVGEGEQSPEGFSDWYEGLTTGKIKD